MKMKLLLLVVEINSTQQQEAAFMVNFDGKDFLAGENMVR